MVTRYNNHCHQSRLVSPRTFDPAYATSNIDDRMETRLASWCVGQGKDYESSVREHDYIVPRRKRIGQLASNVRDVLTVRLAKEEKPAANTSMKCSVLTFIISDTIVYTYDT